MAPPLFKWKKVRSGGNASGSNSLLSARNRNTGTPHLPELSLSAQPLLPQIMNRFALLRGHDTQQVRERLRAQRQRGANAFLTEEEEEDLLAQWSGPHPSTASTPATAHPPPSSPPLRASPTSATTPQFRGTWSSSSSTSGLDRLADELMSNMSASGRAAPFAPHNPNLSPSVGSASYFSGSSSPAPGPSTPTLGPGAVPPPSRAPPPPPEPSAASSPPEGHTFDPLTPPAPPSALPLLASKAASTMPAAPSPQLPSPTSPGASVPAPAAPAPAPVPVPARGPGAALMPEASYEDEEEEVVDERDTEQDLEEGDHLDSAQAKRRSVLENLTPENFKRISQALEEVLQGWNVSPNGVVSEGIVSEALASEEVAPREAAPLGTASEALLPNRATTSNNIAPNGDAFEERTVPSSMSNRPDSVASIDLLAMGIPGGFPSFHPKPSYHPQPPSRSLTTQPPIQKFVVPPSQNAGGARTPAHSQKPAENLANTPADAASPLPTEVITQNPANVPAPVPVQAVAQAHDQMPTQPSVQQSAQTPPQVPARSPARPPAPALAPAPAPALPSDETATPEPICMPTCEPVVSAPEPPQVAIQAPAQGSPRLLAPLPGQASQQAPAEPPSAPVHSLKASDLSPGGTPWSPLSPIARFPPPPHSPQSLTPDMRDPSPGPGQTSQPVAPTGGPSLERDRQGKVAEMAARFNQMSAPSVGGDRDLAACPAGSTTGPGSPKRSVPAAQLDHINARPCSQISVSTSGSSSGSFATASDLSAESDGEEGTLGVELGAEKAPEPYRDQLTGAQAEWTRELHPVQRLDPAHPQGAEQEPNLAAIPVNRENTSIAPAVAGLVPEHAEPSQPHLAHRSVTCNVRDPEPSQPGVPIAHETHQQHGEHQPNQPAVVQPESKLEPEPEPKQRPEDLPPELFLSQESRSENPPPEESQLQEPQPMEPQPVVSTRAGPPVEVPYDEPNTRKETTSPDPSASLVGALSDSPALNPVDPERERARQIAAAQLFGEYMPTTNSSDALMEYNPPEARAGASSPDDSGTAPTPAVRRSVTLKASSHVGDSQPSPGLASNDVSAAPGPEGSPVTRSPPQLHLTEPEPQPEPQTTSEPRQSRPAHFDHRHTPTLDTAPGETLGLGIDRVDRPGPTSLSSKTTQDDAFVHGLGINLIPHVSSHGRGMTSPSPPARAEELLPEFSPKSELPLPSPSMRIETVPPLPSPWAETSHSLMTTEELGVHEHSKRGNFMQRARDALPHLHLAPENSAFEPLSKKAMHSSDGLASPTQQRSKLFQTSNRSSPRLSATVHRKSPAESPPVSRGLRLLGRDASEQPANIPRRKSEGRVSKLFNRIGSVRRRGRETGAALDRQPSVYSASDDAHTGKIQSVRDPASPAVSAPSGSTMATTSLPAPFTTANAPASARAPTGPPATEWVDPSTPAAVTSTPSAAPASIEATPSTPASTELTSIIPAPTEAPPSVSDSTQSKQTPWATHRWQSKEDSISPAIPFSPVAQVHNEGPKFQDAQRGSSAEQVESPLVDLAVPMRSAALPDAEHVSTDSQADESGATESRPEAPHPGNGAQATETGAEAQEREAPSEQFGLGEVANGRAELTAGSIQDEAKVAMPGNTMPESSTKRERRKAGREVVRRTLIFLDEGDENRRKSVMSTLSRSRKGKSRMEPEMEAELLKLIKRQSMSSAVGFSPSAAMDRLEGRRAVPGDGNQSTSVEFPRVDDDAMEQLKFNQPLRLPEPRNRSISTATRFTQSSYAGSVYSNNDEEVTFEASEHEVPPIPAAFRDDAAGRSSLAGLEVMQRADGSIVWQVIHGLSDPGESSTDPYSLLFSRAGARDSSILDTEEEDERRMSTMSEKEGWRNFLLSGRATAHPTAQADDSSYNLPLPPTGSDPAERKSESVHADEATAAEVPDTHVIWTTDDDVAAMLESLSRGIDSAKFEIKLDGEDKAPAAPPIAPPLPRRPVAL